MAKDLSNSNVVDNFGPVSVTATVTRKIAEKIYDYLERDAVLPDEQKRCCWVNLGTKKQLLPFRQRCTGDCKKRDIHLFIVDAWYRCEHNQISH